MMTEMAVCNLIKSARIFRRHAAYFSTCNAAGTKSKIDDLLNDFNEKKSGHVESVEPKKVDVDDGKVDDDGKFSMPATSPDISYLFNPRNRSKIIRNLIDRLVVQSTEEAENKMNELNLLKAKIVADPSAENRLELVEAAAKFPNMSQDDIIELKEPRVMFDNTIDWKSPFISDEKEVKSFEKLAKTMCGVRTDNTGQTTTEKSYYLLNSLAELEQGLIRFTVDELTKKYGFTLISVPDLLHPDIFKACGMPIDRKITQVFRLDPKFYGPQVLSGTSEMAICGYLKGKKLDFDQSVPGYKKVKKFAAVSRCYRAESTMGKRERGIYRVHHFTKVEMFAVAPSSGDTSAMVHESFLDVQKRLFDDLGLSYRVLDMHPADLGNPAARKYDCEAYLPGRSRELGEPFYGEISSTSNCTDYQSRRLNIRDERTGQFCHTVNGTACAVPRMVMAICEQFQQLHGAVHPPAKLLPYLPNVRKAFDSLIQPPPRKTRPSFNYYRSPTYHR